MLELFLSDRYKSHWPTIQKYASDDSPEAFEKLRKYALEAYRLATPAFGLLRIVDADTATIQDGPHTITVKKGDQLYVDFVRPQTPKPPSFFQPRPTPLTPIPQNRSPQASTPRNSPTPTKSTSTAPTLTTSTTAGARTPASAAPSS